MKNYIEKWPIFYKKERVFAVATIFDKSGLVLDEDNA